jgi:hypothetical protein
VKHQYSELDAAILAAVKDPNRPHILYHRACRHASRRISVLTGRDEFHIIDGRLQALRRAGKIRHVPKGLGGNGWEIVEP